MATHLVFTVFGLFTNILVTAMLLTGGSAAFTALTGVPTPAACFLLPLGVIVYTMFGGIKATFLTWVYNALGHAAQTDKITVTTCIPSCS